MDYFELPRKDWYDSEGRIYKDRLIENFNAIEAKLQAIREADGADINEIDWTSISLPDVTLASDDNKIVNLESFISIMGLNDGFPVVQKFNGKKIVTLKYYYNNTLHVISDYEPVSVSNGNYLWLTPSTETLEVIDGNTLVYRVSNLYTGMCVAGYTNGKWYGMYNNMLCDYDIMEALSKMAVRGIPFSSANNQLGSNSQTTYKDRFSGRRLGCTKINSRAGDMLYLTLPDIGYEGDGQR